MAEPDRISAASVQLLPFPGGRRDLAAFAITGQVQRRGRQMVLQLALSWPPESAATTAAAATAGSIVWPDPAAGAPQRRDGLWQHTCLELFVAAAGQPGYWEFNLAPNGDWAAYRLEGYRQGLRPEPAYAALPFSCSHSPGRFALELDLLLPPPLQASQPLQAAVTAVLEHGDGALSTWALHHGGSEPDFHRRDGFLLRL